MKKRYKILIPFAIVLLILVIGKAFHDVKPRALSTIQSESTLVVATEFSVLNYQLDYDQEQEYGFLFEIVKAFAESQSWQLKVVVENDLAKSIEGLNCGKYDMIMRLLPVTTEMQNEATMSMPILKNHLVLVQRQPADEFDKPLIDNVIELDGRKIFMPIHSADMLVLRHVSDELGIDFELETVDNANVELLLSMVARNEADFSVTDSHTACYIQKYFPQLNCSVQVGFEQLRAFAFPKHETAVQQLFDDWFVIYRETTEFADLQKKYLDL